MKTKEQLKELFLNERDTTMFMATVSTEGHGYRDGWDRQIAGLNSVLRQLVA